jgi:predicted DNA-binding WGR domain protein
MTVATPTSERLIFTALETNNNKFWHGEVVGTEVRTLWGRVGDAGTPTNYQCGSVDAAEKKLATLVRSKLKKGYTRQHTMGAGETVQVKTGNAVKINHNNDPETTALVDFLVQRNIHKIEGMTTIRFEAGRLTTPL